MSSSGSGSGVDCGVGSIVWVRRRNGSWWPGKILGPDDVSTSHLTSPRSGTPVKLLGREDASIDWYNLEKSKRVKAFRCGEFDDCIERAEASLGLPPKKREKYARREDAILHALQLERQLRKQGTSDHINNKSSGTVKKESGPLSKKLGNDDGKIVISKPSKARGSCEPSRENDLETVPRTKGLRDFGLRIAPSKRKFSSIDSKDTCELNNNSQALPDDVSIRNARHTNGMEQIGVAFPSKRSKCVSLPTDPTNIVEDGKKIPSSLVEMAEEDNHPHLGSAAEINPSKVVEKSESDNSDTESDSTETEPDIDGRMFSHSDVSLPLETDLNSLRRSGAPAMDEILSSEDYDGSPFSGEMTNIYSNDHYSAGETVSKWQLKGKRNIRSLTRRPVDTTRGRGSQNTFTCFSRKFPEQSSGYYRKEDFIDDDDDDSDFYPEDNRMERAGVDNREYMFTPRCVSKYKNRLGCDSINWDSVWEDQTSLKGHWEDRWEQSNPVYVSHHYYGDRMRPILIDVDLKVQGAGYQRGSVPLISLTSKASGQPVVGHPIQVEVLEDGSTENLFSNNAGSDYEMTDYEGIATLPPAWKTARRTAHSRVPRPHLSSNLDGNEYAEVIFPSDQEMGEEPFKKSSPMRKSQTNLLHPLNSRRGPGKSPKKASISPGQRTRTLSSIAADQRFSNKHMDGFSSNRQMDGINKTQSPGPRSVALIPCKLVFSRMLEKINRPPSKS